MYIKILTCPKCRNQEDFVIKDYDERVVYTCCMCGYEWEEHTLIR